MILRLARTSRSVFRAKPTERGSRSMTRSIWLLVGCLVLVSSTLIGCGGGDDDAEESWEGKCFIAVGVEGAVNYEQTHGDLFCLYLTSYESGISTVFIPYNEPFDSITLDVEEIEIDEVGTFPASLTFSHEDGRTFRSDECEVAVDAHEPDGEDSEAGLSYQFHGTGRCASPAVSQDEASETLTIADFEFASGVIWGGTSE